ncbi:murein DD-endopeptidase MepM/ murein hydrolase activator NlpD [Sphingomonas jejuensis]|uniref:Murein DD-endopeptidase MepM/ murein hydrolase activator NlpD n=1 Tax=Sphingomonas jejuensis TaxID=904715 RepID=A0ABX0XPJ9_9SPHN|nr:peptidoglycan DD-metalloendopeptidase family protein [Sphingomonas jejuensis]NJC35160.1 murein DD-endopeptidase MepM/ murein hydrolase activator NlpD [Sphingomonas jejuensis]
MAERHGRICSPAPCWPNSCGARPASSPAIPIIGRGDLRALAALSLLLLIGAAADRRDQAADAARHEAARSRSQAAEAVAARSRAAAARAERVRLAATVQDAERAVAAADRDAAAARERAAQLGARLARDRAPVAALVGGIQSAARRPAMLAVLQPGSIADQVHLRAVLATVVPAVEARTAVLRNHVAGARRARAEADRAAGSATAAHAALRTAIAALSAAERRAVGDARVADTAAARAAERALGLGERARTLGISADREAQGTATLAALAALPPPAPPPGAPPRRLPPADAYRQPVIGTLVAGFGEWLAGGAENGLAFRVRPGALVVAPAAGIVRYAAPFRSYGGVVVIDHGGGWTSTLTGLARIGRRAGDPVAAGMALGGAIGDDRPLRLELRRGGRPVPPAPLVSRG